MMLGTKDLQKELGLGNSGDVSYLSIIPEPSIVDNSSVDLHLGRWFLQPHQSRSAFYDFAQDEPDDKRFTSKQYFSDFGEEFVLHPGRFILAITLEWVRLPTNRAGYLTGKSNIGRRGLVIETAPGVHPNFNGCLTLEMTNLGEIPLLIRPGMRICQLFVHHAGDSPPAAGSQFSAQIKPTFGRNR
jgi:dCTP deaminase